MKNLTEIYPLQYEASGSNSGLSVRTFGANRSKGNVIYEVDQEVNNLDSIEIFKTAEVASATDRRAVIEAPKEIEIENTGDAGLGLVLKIPTWTNDTTQSGSTHIQMVLGQGERLVLPTTQIIKSADGVLNDGTVVASFTTPSTDLYVDSTANTDDVTGTDNVDNSASNTTVYLEPYTSADNCTANLFRVGDLIRIRDEIMEVTAIGTKADLANNTLTVKRGVYGSTATTNTDDEDAVRLAFFNMTRKFDAFTSTCTDESGVFQASNFFGLGRGLTIGNSGILPGSVAFKFYSEPYQEMGCSNLTQTSDSGLTSGLTYYIKVAVNSGTAFEVAFTVDSVKIGGSTGVLRKIQDVLDTQHNTAGSALLNKRVSVSLVNGDVRWTFHERKVGSTIALSAGTSGSDATTELLNGATGVFPATAESAVPTELPVDTVFDSKTYKEMPNRSQFLYDDGMGNIVGDFGTGVINYETGSFSIRTYKNADITYVVSHSSALSGRASSTKTNIVEQVFAKSTCPKVNSKVRVTVKG